MSKSLGNGVDPLEVIDQYGADALRFSLATGNSPGNDMRYIVNQSRLTGFNKAAEEVGFAQEDILLYTDINNYRACAAAVEECLQKGVRRFLAMDEDVCVHVLRALEQCMWLTPGDLRIYSMADNDALSNYRYPVSAVRFDAGELGQIACRELLRCLRDENYDPKPILGYRIIER